jgi:hypothetical protein
MFLQCLILKVLGTALDFIDIEVFRENFGIVIVIADFLTLKMKEIYLNEGVPLY